MNRQANQLPKALQNIDIKAVLRKRGVYNKLSYNQSLKEAALPLAKQLLQEKHTPVHIKVDEPISVHFTNEQIVEYAEKQIHIVDVLEKKFNEKVRQFITKMEKGFLAHLEDEVATIKSKDFFSDNVDDFVTEAQIDFTPLLDQQAVLAGQEAYKLLGIKDIYFTSEQIHTKVRENIAEFTKSMLNTDREHLVDLISNGIESGQSINEIRNAITADFENIKKVQAERVTRTEVMRVSNEASIDAYKQSGVVESKQWLGYDPCPECEVYDGDIVELSGDFPDGDPPLHPNCRCVVLPVLADSTELAYTNEVNKKLKQRIIELEAKFDKRTKEFKQLKQNQADDLVYIKSLEKHLGVSDEE